MTMTGGDTSQSLLNLPNQLTSLRLALAFVLFGLIWLDQWLASVIVFLAAAFTDWLDGYYARNRGLISPLGRVYDPLVDKVLVCGAFIFLLEEPGASLNAFMITVVVAREFIVTGLRGFLEEKGVSFGADWLGKIKMVLQCAAITWILATLGAAADQTVSGIAAVIRDALNWSMVAVTIASGANYIRRALDHLW